MQSRSLLARQRQLPPIYLPRRVAPVWSPPCESYPVPAAKRGHRLRWPTRDLPSWTASHECLPGRPALDGFL